MDPRRLRYVFQLEAGADGAAGGSGAAGGDAGAGAGGAGAAGAGGGDGAAAGAGAAGGSALAAGAAAAGAGAGGEGAGGEAADPNGWIPEKHRVFGEDGKTLNLEASARKVADAYSAAEKRIGTGDVPPKAAADYKVTVPEALKDKVTAEDFVKADTFKGFMEKAHALKLTQAQFDGVVGDFIERSLALQGGVQQLSEQECVADLRKEWTNDADYQKNMQAAYRAGAAFGDIKTILDKYGNDPVIVRMLAKVGAELAEDKSAPAGSMAGQESNLDALRLHPAYMNPNHPEHTTIKGKVEALMQQQYGNAPKGAGPIVISSV